MHVWHQVVGFVPVSGRTGKGVDKLSSELISIALQQSYVPETVPISYMALEQVRGRGGRESIGEKRRIFSFLNCCLVLHYHYRR